MHLCQKSPSLRLLQSLLKGFHERKGKFRCGSCGHMFPTICSLHLHLLAYSGYSSYNYDYATNTAYPRPETSHIATHTDESDHHNNKLKTLFGVPSRFQNAPKTQGDPDKPKSTSGSENINLTCSKHSNKSLAPTSEKHVSGIEGENKAVAVRVFNLACTEEGNIKYEIAEDQVHLHDATAAAIVKRMEQQGEQMFQETSFTLMVSPTDDRTACMPTEKPGEVGANPVLQSEDAASDNLKQVEDNVLQADKQSLLISDIHNVSDTLLPVDKSANTKESTTLNCRRSSRTKRVSAKFSSNEFVSDIDIRKSYAETEDISDNPLEGSETSLTSENQHLDSVTSKAHINYMNRKGNKVKRLKTHTGTRKPKSVNSGKKQKPVNKSAVCPTCGKVGTLGMVKYHRQVHAGDAKFVCEVCDKLYYTKEALRSHMLFKHSEKQYKCGYCSEAFHQKRYLDNHEMKHTGEDPFKHQCDLCGQKFKESYILRRHVKNAHEKQRNFECDICHMTFFRLDTRDNHHRRHFDATLPCSYCPKKFKCTLDVKKHELTHTGRKPFHCSLCSHRFTQLWSYYKHMWKIHNISKEPAKEMRDKEQEVGYLKTVNRDVDNKGVNVGELVEGSSHTQIMETDGVSVDKPIEQILTGVSAYDTVVETLSENMQVDMNTQHASPELESNGTVLTLNVQEGSELGESSVITDRGNIIIQKFGDVGNVVIYTNIDGDTGI